MKEHREKIKIRYNFRKEKRTRSYKIKYVQKVLRNFVVDISLQLLEQFQQTNSHFKEHVKVYLLYKNDGFSLRNKRDINVRIPLNICQTFYIPSKKIVIVYNAR